MDSIEIKILRSFLERSADGLPVNIFDVIYDADCRYAQMQPYLKSLEERGQIKPADDENYIFTGDRSLLLKELQAKEEPAGRSAKTEAGEPPRTKSLSEMMDELKKRTAGRPIEEQRFAMRSVLQNMQEEDDGDDFEYEDDDEDDDGEEDSVPRFRDREMSVVEFGIKALKLCIQKGEASVSLVQRNFPIGYIMSCKVIDWMESMGYISEALGNKPRKVLITAERFKQIYGD